MATEDEIKKRLDGIEQQLESVHLKVDKIKRTMAWASFYGFVKFLIIIVPLVWAYIFFQPQIQEFYSLYGKMMQQFRSFQTIQQPQTGSNTDCANPLQQLREACAQLRQ